MLLVQWLWLVGCHRESETLIVLMLFEADGCCYSFLGFFWEFQSRLFDRFLEPDHARVKTWLGRNPIIFVIFYVFNFSINCIGILTVVSSVDLILILAARKHLSWTWWPEHMAWLVCIMVNNFLNFIEISNATLFNFLKSMTVTTKISLIAWFEIVNKLVLHCSSLGIAAWT